MANNYGNNYRNNNRNGNAYKVNLSDKYQNIIKKEEIFGTEYVDVAEKVIKVLMDDRSKLTTSKLRNIMAMTAEIYNEAMESDENLSDDTKSRIEYLRMRIVYEAGRESSVKDFVIASKLLDALKEVKGKKSSFVRVYHYLEALVAYFKFYDGKEQ